MRGQRLLLDSGVMEGASSQQPRYMAFATDQRADRRKGSPELVEVFRTSAGAVVMDGPAAGSSRVGVNYHGRFGEAGLTVSVDLVLKSERSRIAKGQSIAKHNKSVYRYFHLLLTPVELRTWGTPGLAAANAAARAAAAAAAAASLEDPHCWWCAAGREAVYNWASKDGHRFCLTCYSSFKDAPAADRPAARVCAGCEGCSKEAPLHPLLRRRRRRKNK